MNLLGSFDRFVAICDDGGIIISLFFIVLYNCCKVLLLCLIKLFLISGV